MWNRISTLLPSHHHRQSEDITLTQGRGALININIRTRTSHWSDTGRGALIKARPLTPCCPHLPLSEVSTFIFNTKIQNTLLISSSFHQIWQYIYKDSKHIYIWPYRFPRVFGDEFGDKFGDSLNFVSKLVTHLVIISVNHRIWW